jgi:hypothetical protein
MRFSQPMTRNLHKCIEEVQNCPEPKYMYITGGVLVQWCIATLARCSVQSSYEYVILFIICGDIWIGV